MPLLMPEFMMPPSQSYDLTTRAQAITLKLYGASYEKIEEICGIKKRMVQRYLQTAKERGYDPLVDSTLKDEYLIDAPRSGRPRKLTKEQEMSLCQSITVDRNNREKPSLIIATEYGDVKISASTVQRILRKHGIKKRKATWKPGLTKKMQAERLAFCLEHQYWTSEQWKAVIWTDETAIILGHQRGGVRLWRTSEDRYEKTCVRARWHGAMEFMFCGSFSYVKKGPCHIWKPETAKEKKAAQLHLDKLNAEAEPDATAAWELEAAMDRLNVERTRPGKKPLWKYTAERGAIIRQKGKGGIDWWRYRQTILIPKLLPFAVECQADRPDTIVMEDKAPCHISRHQQAVYLLFHVMKMIWCGNSPDINTSEPCWPWMK